MMLLSTLRSLITDADVSSQDDSMPKIKGAFMGVYANIDVRDVVVSFVKASSNPSRDERFI